ncbi:MAG: LD-carboxypeptidase [Chitinophagaceae bacterium]|nr:LD-carboxypeptidase [Chitinophagaceae bacterium]MBK9531308.1 LD-carboxypeptidase [Chitinophagaceae bacterium]HQW92605.1 LD-carboxypeptidase [Ferruginibacter sp.]
MKIKIPPYLKKGDTIGITCPAGYMATAKAQTCIETLQSWGFQVMVGKTLGSRSKNYFSANDETRSNEMQAMLDDENIHAILCGRGGYGVTRIIDGLDFTRFKKNPKWIIGFSDITVLHAHLYSRIKVASMHAPMAAAFNEGENKYILALQKALTGKKAKYDCAAHPFNKAGIAKAELVGGNLSLLVHLIGTPSDIKTKDKLLFIEDIGEHIYNIDRMLYQLKRSGKLDNLAGLVVGGFTDMHDTERPFGKKVYKLIKEITNGYDYPVCFNFPVSHNKENYALKIGVRYTLTISKNKTRLTEDQ